MDPELLRRAANQRLFDYIKNKAPQDVEVDSDIKKELDKQHQYQSNSVATLTKKFETSKAAHKEDNKKIMENNMYLIEQISHLRKEVNMLNEQFMARGGKNFFIKREEDMKQEKLLEAEREKEERMQKHLELFTKPED